MKLLTVVCALITVVATAPGLLRVPKIYNAVITSNQNLSPSRAFPVIQPVVHRTAVGYVPPFYYTQVAPYLAGPEVVHRLPDGQVQASTVPSSRFAESTSFGVARDRGRTVDRKGSPNDELEVKESPKEEPTKEETMKKNERPPLSFYPNYHSLYYEPYAYTYHSFNPHFVPGAYYVDYQPYSSTLEPVPPTGPPTDVGEPGRLLPGFHDEAEEPAKDERERIPDVPPPPLPTSVPNKS